MKQMEKFTYNGLLLITNSIFLAIIYWVCHGRVYIYSTGKTGGYISGMALIAFEVMVMITLYIIHDYLRIERTVKNLIKHCGISASAIGFVSLIGMPFGNRAITIIRAVMFVTAAFIVFIIARHLHKLKKEGHIIPARKALLKYYTLVMPVVATVGFIFAGIQIHNVVRAQREYDRYVQASENKNSTTDGVVDAENIIEIASKLTSDTYAIVTRRMNQKVLAMNEHEIKAVLSYLAFYISFCEEGEIIALEKIHISNIIKQARENGLISVSGYSINISDEQIDTFTNTISCQSGIITLINENGRIKFEFQDELVMCYLAAEYINNLSSMFEGDIPAEFYFNIQ